MDSHQALLLYLWYWEQAYNVSLHVQRGRQIVADYFKWFPYLTDSPEEY